jgi:hypothetical protein
VKPEIGDRTTWTRGYIVQDDINRILICVNEKGEVVGQCSIDLQPYVVKRWIIKVGEFKRVNIVNQIKFLDRWNKEMVDDDNDRYKSIYGPKEERTPVQD